MKKAFLILGFVLTSIFGFAQDVFNAARNNDLATIEKYIAEGGDVNVQDLRGFTPLVLAIYNNNFEASQLLLEKGANPNAQDRSGNTALMGATFKALPTMVDLLIQHKVNVNQKNFNQATALIFAATFGQKDIAKKLLEKGADKTIVDNTGKTALDHAMIQDNKELINLLK